MSCGTNTLYVSPRHHTVLLSSGLCSVTHSGCVHTVGVFCPLHVYLSVPCCQVVSPMDPRIHFALVCGAKSCPPIKLYSSDTLQEALTGAAEAFCASEVIVDVAAKKVGSAL